MSAKLRHFLYNLISNVTNVTPLMFSTYSLTLLASLETNVLSVSFVIPHPFYVKIKLAMTPQKQCYDYHLKHIVLVIIDTFFPAF